MNRRSFLTTGAAAAVAPLLLRVPGAGAATSLFRSSGGPDLRGTEAFGFPEPDMTSVVTKDITFPHEGPRNWTDTYGACRDGCSRRHEGQDLLGPKLTKLLACVDGTIVELRHLSEGNSLYLEGDDGWYYAYLHINNDTPGTDDGANPFEWAFAPGMANGVKVRRGQFIAYRGDSGNAEATVPHLHFEIRKPADSVWHAQAVNPKYSLLASRPPPPSVSPHTFIPWDNPTDYVHQQYVDFLGREPAAGVLASAIAILQSGERTPGQFTRDLVESAESQDRNGAVLRMYRAFFARNADNAGYLFWLGKLRAGLSVGSLAERWATSNEFTTRYAAMGNGTYVDNVYLNVLGRAPDSSGSAYWTDQLDRGLIDRAHLMLLFSESNENRDLLRGPVNVTIIHTAMLRRMPSQLTIDTWYWRVSESGASLATMVDTLRKSSEYGRRFA